MINVLVCLPVMNKKKPDIISNLVTVVHKRMHLNARILNDYIIVI